MGPSSWKLYVDDFPFFGSSLACLEPELELYAFVCLLVLDMYAFVCQPVLIGLLVFA